MDESRRRPFIDWIHTANVQGEQVRHYVKWDYQPGSIEGVPDSFARAYAAMMTEPQGPIYMCYDAWLQEQPLTKSIALRSAATPRCRCRWRPTVRRSSRSPTGLLAARFPVLAAEYTGVAPNGFADLVKLAETVGAAVYDTNGRLNFPNRQSAQCSMDRSVFADARPDPQSRHPRLGETDPQIERTERTVAPLYPTTAR